MNFIKSFWKTITWAIIVLILSAITGETVKELGEVHIPHFDKFVHFGMYFTFTFLMINDVIRSYGSKYSILQIIIFCASIAIIYGGSMEFLQSIPELHRTKDFHDFLANSFGALTAGIFYKQLIQMVNWCLSPFIKLGKRYSL
jgi:VanZ family protein